MLKMKFFSKFFKKKKERKRVASCDKIQKKTPLLKYRMQLKQPWISLEDWME